MRGALMCIKEMSGNAGHTGVMQTQSFFAPFSWIFASVTLAVSAIAAPVSPQGEERIFAVTGVIRALLDDGQIVIEHEEIPGFMPAMTMAFSPTDSREAAGLVVNDRVRFRLRVGSGRSVAEEFVVISRVPASKSQTTPITTDAKRNGKYSGRLREGDEVPAFSLIDERGQPLTAETLQGRFTVVTFIFTRCPVPEFCPVISLKFKQLQSAISSQTEAIGKTRLLAITLDPEFDRPEILKAYGEAMRADPAVWNFATGDKPQIDALVKAFAVYREKNGVVLDHTLATALVRPDGRIIEIWRGNKWTADEIFACVRNKNAENTTVP
ncbi:electron transporter SenC [Opitutaceae bacterium TAV4]|nr:electron transporter SenC [Opitutaceae bacterium TAV4]RRK02064.1 electron transporter SenC [Opitutaceae bacterium TAV3]